MPRVHRGNIHDLPPGMSPMEWARAVSAMMDTTDVSQKEAQAMVMRQAEREARQDAAAANRAVNGPPVDKMVRTNGVRTKGENPEGRGRQG